MHASNHEIYPGDGDDAGRWRARGCPAREGGARGAARAARINLRSISREFARGVARGGWRAVLGVLGGLAIADRAMALNPALTVFQYNTRSWHRSNGLPAEAISALAQTPDGQVWLGTAKGLVKFDGVEFDLVGLPGQLEGAPTLVAGLEARAAGGLWVAIERGGFGVYEGPGFHQTPVSGVESATPTTRIVHQSRDGELFLSFVGRTGRLLPSGLIDFFLPSTDVQCMYEDKQGRIWFGTTLNGLQYWEHGQLRTVGGAAEKLWHGAVISAVAVDQAGLIWVGASNGLHCLNPDFSPRPPTGIGAQARSLLVDRHGVLWVGTLSAGLVRVHDDQRSTLTQRDGLASDRVLTLMESSDGSLWVGTEDGLSQLSDVKFPIISQADGLAAEACLTVAAAKDGGIWAGTVNGLSLIRDGTIRNFGVGKSDGFTSEWIRRVLPTQGGDVYLLVGGLEICRFRDGRVDRSWPTATWAHGLAETAAGVVTGVGTELMVLERERLVPYRLADGSPVRLEWINELLGARDGSLWVATKSGVVQIKEGKLRPWQPEHNPSDNAFYFLCEAADGAVWAARNGGLVRFKDGQARSVDHRHGLPDNLTYTLVADRMGDFWIESPSGLFRVKQAQLNAVADGAARTAEFTVYEGQHVMKTADKSTREYSVCRSSDGRLWLPSSKGVVVIDPARVPLNTTPPPVFLQRMLVDGKAYPMDRAPALKPGQGNLEFDYVAVDYQAPARIRYRYRLEGYETGWQEAGARRFAFYTNLDPGAYRFTVQACNADGVWNEAGASFALNLPYRYYQQPWFQVLAVFLSLGLLGGAWTVWDRRRRKEFATIQRQELLQRQMIDGSPVAMVLLDERRQVLHINATFTRIFGYGLADLADIHAWWLSVCLDPLGRDRLLPLPGVSATTELSLETTVIGRDGVQRTVLLTRARVGPRTLLAFTDLTDRIRAEEQRRHLAEQVRQGQKMEAIGLLSGGVAHDFNNLLTVILGNVSLAETVDLLPSDVKDPLNQIKGAAQRAANLTRQLLTFSRKQTMSPTRLDLNQVVTDLTRMLQRILGEDIRMDMRLSPQPVRVYADAGMIEQVLMNLVVNARDAMPRGGTLTISTNVIEIDPAAPRKTQERPGCFVQLAVRDTGVGIAADVLPRIFEPFFTTKEVGRGTGLGLATVYGIVEQHEGWIDVQSEVGHGTVFEVNLPALSEESSPPVAATSAAEKTAGGARVILLVEDDPAVRMFVCKALKMRGHHVFEASSGRAALEVWQAHAATINLLLTDVVMPDGMNGLELAQRLLQERPRLKVIYTSGYSTEVAGDFFAGRQGIDFLPKPFSPIALLRMIDRLDE